MGSFQFDSQISAGLFGKSRRGILGLMFSEPDKSFYLRQIIRILGLGQGAIQRELATLKKAGLLNKRSEGNLVYYQANPQSPIFSELKSLVLKTTGFGEAIRKGLEKISKKIEFAFIYGSFASGQETNESDIDLMVVGQVTFREVASALSPVQENMGRDINFSVYSRADFKRKIKSGHHFLNSLLKSPKIYLIGENREFKRMAT